jgi:hypothetical protein
MPACRPGRFVLLRRSANSQRTAAHAVNYPMGRFSGASFRTITVPKSTTMPRERTADLGPRPHLFRVDSLEHMGRFGTDLRFAAELDRIHGPCRQIRSRSAPRPMRPGSPGPEYPRLATSAPVPVSPWFGDGHRRPYSEVLGRTLTPPTPFTPPSFTPPSFLPGASCLTRPGASPLTLAAALTPPSTPPSPMKADNLYAGPALFELECELTSLGARSQVTPDGNLAPFPQPGNAEQAPPAKGSMGPTACAGADPLRQAARVPHAHLESGLAPPGCAHAAQAHWEPQTRRPEKPAFPKPQS